MKGLCRNGCQYTEHLYSSSFLAHLNPKSIWKTYQGGCAGDEPTDWVAREHLNANFISLNAFLPRNCL